MMALAFLLGGSTLDAQYDKVAALGSTGMYLSLLCYRDVGRQAGEV